MCPAMICTVPITARPLMEVRSEHAEGLFVADVGARGLPPYRFG